MNDGGKSMSTFNFELNNLVRLLGRSENDPEVRNFFGRQMANIERNEYYGFLQFKPDGVDVVFNEAPWVLPSEKITDPKELYLIAFHFHRKGHEGYAEYSGRFPNGVAFGDPETEILRKMGQPIARGGGNTFSGLNRPVPYWVRYAFGDSTLRFQLDATGLVDMTTLSMPSTKQVAA
jgi:hypothetical protein